MGVRQAVSRAADGLRRDAPVRLLRAAAHTLLWGLGAALGHWLLHAVGIGG